MDKFKSLSERTPPFNLENHNYREFYNSFIIDEYFSYAAKTDKRVAPGKLIFEVLCDNKVPISYYQHNGNMCDEDSDDPNDDWLSEPILHSLWYKKASHEIKRVGTLKLPSTGRLFVNVAFQSRDIFYQQIDAHATLLMFDVDNKTVEFFDPNGASWNKHSSLVDIMKSYVLLFGDFTLIDVGNLCQPQTWFHYKHGICMLWVYVYTILRLDEPQLSPTDIGKFLRKFSLEAINNILSNLMAKLWKKFDRTGYKALFKDHTIPYWIQQYIPENYKNDGAVISRKKRKRTKNE